MSCRAKQEKAAAAETLAMADITTNLDASERFDLPGDTAEETAGEALHGVTSFLTFDLSGLANIV